MENNNEAQEQKKNELEPINEIERSLVSLRSNEITSEDFLAELFNETLFVLTSEDQVDKQKGRLVDNPMLFTLFGDRKQPFLVIFTTKDRAHPVVSQIDKFKILIEVKVGDLIANANTGIVVDPFWDKSVQWEPEQIATFRQIMKRDENGLWTKLPDEELITVFTQEGHPLKISREQFRKDILPKQIEEIKSNSEELYKLIVTAVNDNMAEDVLEASKYLYENDDIKERAVIGYGLVLTTLKKYDEAEAVFSSFLSENKSPMVMGNLARIYDLDGRKEEAFKLLEDSLKLDPNMDGALEWYCGLVNEKGGNDAVIEALDELEGLAGSWRPALLLGRAKLLAKKVDEALEHYQDALEVEEHTTDALVIITAELGQSGLYDELIDFGLKHYRIDRDDPRAGLNILRAGLDSKQKDKVFPLAEQMEKIPVPQLQEEVKKLKAELEKL